MNKKYVAGFVLLMAVCLVWVLAEKHKPPTDGSEFWTYITKTNPYAEWESWPGYEDIYPGQSPHGAFLKLYVNGKAFKAIKGRKVPLPSGSIIVKENYDKDKETLVAVTPMYKVEGYNPEAGDWFWGKYGSDGKVMAAGKVKGCIDCHRQKKDMDWLFTEIK